MTLPRARALTPQDETIHKRVFAISGSIPAVNYLKLPRKAIALTGRFCYLQVRTMQQCQAAGPPGQVRSLLNGVTALCCCVHVRHARARCASSLVRW